MSAKYTRIRLDDDVSDALDALALRVGLDSRGALLKQIATLVGRNPSSFAAALCPWGVSPRPPQGLGETFGGHSGLGEERVSARPPQGLAGHNVSARPPQGLAETLGEPCAGSGSPGPGVSARPPQGLAETLPGHPPPTSADLPPARGVREEEEEEEEEEEDLPLLLLDEASRLLGGGRHAEGLKPDEAAALVQRWREEAARQRAGERSPIGVPSKFCRTVLANLRRNPAELASVAERYHDAAQAEAKREQALKARDEARKRASARAAQLEAQAKAALEHVQRMTPKQRVAAAKRVRLVAYEVQLAKQDPAPFVLEALADELQARGQIPAQTPARTA